MKNGLFTLDWASMGDAVVTAVVVAIVTVIYGAATSSGFDLFSANWTMILHNTVNAGFIAAVVSLGQNFISTNNGSVLGITPPTTPTA